MKRLFWIVFGVLALAILGAVARQERATLWEDELFELARMQKPLPRQLVLVARLQWLGRSEARGSDLKQWEAMLQVQIANCRETVGRSEFLPANADDQQKFDVVLARGQALYLLEKHDAAARALRVLLPDSPRATLLLAVILAEQQQWRESDAWYERTLTMLDARALDDAMMNDAARRQAYDGLAWNGRKDGRPADAESAYRRAIAAMPSAQGYFHLQLGRHFMNGGRPADALPELELAAQDESYHQRSRHLIRELQTSTPACAFFSPGAP
jgi:hypothetical protein